MNGRKLYTKTRYKNLLWITSEKCDRALHNLREFTLQLRNAMHPLNNAQKMVELSFSLLFFSRPIAYILMGARYMYR